MFTSEPQTHAPAKSESQPHVLLLLYTRPGRHAHQNPSQCSCLIKSHDLSLSSNVQCTRYQLLNARWQEPAAGSNGAQNHDDQQINRYCIQPCVQDALHKCTARTSSLEGLELGRSQLCTHCLLPAHMLKCLIAYANAACRKLDVGWHSQRCMYRSSQVTLQQQFVVCWPYLLAVVTIVLQMGVINLVIRAQQPAAACSACRVACPCLLT